MATHQRIRLALIVCIMLSCGLSFGANTNAAADGTGQHSIIWAAIDATSSGDVIWLADGTDAGTVHRDVFFNGKAVIIVSEHGPEHCIIDCQGSNSDPHIVRIFNNGEAGTSRIQRLTITGASGLISASSTKGNHREKF